MHTHFLQILEQAEWIHGVVSSITTPGIAEMLLKLAERGTPIELVVPESLAGKLMSPPYVDMMEHLVDIATFALYVYPEPLRIGMTATNSCLSLGLYKRGTRIYNLEADLVSRDPRAVSWGEQLFRYYKAGAEKLSLK